MLPIVVPLAIRFVSDDDSGVSLPVNKRSQDYYRTLILVIIYLFDNKRGNNLDYSTLIVCLTLKIYNISNWISS